MVIVGDHVTLESGTGCVHTAPGSWCGRLYGRSPKLSGDPLTVVPVDAEGRHDGGGRTVRWADHRRGQQADCASIWMRADALFALPRRCVHQYPHCWRCQEPILFRATESQWFCSVDDFKDNWLYRLPPRMCKWISRLGRRSACSPDGPGARRLVHLPSAQVGCCRFPVFYCKDVRQGRSLTMPASRLQRYLRSPVREGSDAWFKYPAEAEYFLPEGYNVPALRRH